MKPRHNQRLIQRIRAGAALCRVPIVDWVRLTRDERKARLAKARKGHA